MTIALVYGGRSAEHDVSISSAKTMHQALRQAGFSVLLIAITLEGRWYLQQAEVSKHISTDKPVFAAAGLGFFVGDAKLAIDAVFATTHGYGGEDGNLQGLCMLSRLPLCGCDTVCSALGMHKYLAAVVFESEHIPTVPTLVLTKEQVQDGPFDQLLVQSQSRLGPDLFVKPENSGSSVGVSALMKSNLQSFQDAVKLAGVYSERVLVQQLIHPLLEVETAVLQTSDRGLVIAGPGLVVDPAKQNVGYLSYEHKYGQVDPAHIRIPSGLDAGIECTIIEYARKAFLAIKGDGYARIDFFVSGNRIYLNEINTSPGMTGTSHYPALMASIGYDLPTICRHLVADALKRNAEERQRIYTPPRR